MVAGRPEALLRDPLHRHHFPIVLRLLHMAERSAPNLGGLLDLWRQNRPVRTRSSQLGTLFNDNIDTRQPELHHLDLETQDTRLKTHRPATQNSKTA
eukprot:1385409-Rhodomonas_salina.1